ncbi:MAG: histidine phosphatase family protein [Gemmatimonadaceae bacterium]|nr:histidine phosphatase family protein [Gemmatimonadaceae bacterium]
MTFRRLPLAAMLLLTMVVVPACAHVPAAGAVAASAAPAVSPMLVVVVRHAEKAPLPANDPVLSEAGMARAAALDGAVRSLPITDVVVSHLQRTRLTASAFLARTGVPVHVVPIGSAGVAAHVKAVADTVRALSRLSGHTGVLVVGHSNTVTDIVQALGGAPSAALCDSQYSQLFTVRGDARGGVVATRTTYGAADPVDASCGAMAPR